LEFFFYFLFILPLEDNAAVHLGFGLALDARAGREN
jgi:hypothetical protein